MKPRKLKLPTLASIVTPLIFAMPLQGFAAAADKIPPTLADSNTSTKPLPIKTTQEDAQKQIVKQAVDAANATSTALQALTNNQPKQALAALQIASGNLHLLLARNPAMGLTPIDMQVQVLKGVNDLNAIKKLENELNDLLDDGQYQAARPMIDSLADEMRVTVISLPLATYPAAIDRIAPMIDAGKLADAKNELVKTLDTLVYEQVITPLSIIRAEDKLDEAFQIEHQEDLTQQTTKDKISQLVSEANQEIKIAEALGYGNKNDFALLYDGMDGLKKVIGTDGFKGEWTKIKNAIATFKNRVVHPAG